MLVCTLRIAKHMELLRDEEHEPLALTAGVAKFVGWGAKVPTGSWQGVRDAYPRGV